MPKGKSSLIHELKKIGLGIAILLAMALFDFDKDITFSVLPFSPFGKVLAGRLSAKGAELMLHLPMEPIQYPRVNPGPGALLSSMSPDALLAQLRKGIDAVPGGGGQPHGIQAHFDFR